MLFTDTYSLAYEIEIEDFYADLAKNIDELFDTSDYPKDRPAVNIRGFKTGCNEKVIGKFKCDLCGNKIHEFVGLRA